MIRSFADRLTKRVYDGENPPEFPPEILPVARRKMDRLNAVSQLFELRIPPGNHFEALKGDKSGYYSIRVNNQWRIVFGWDTGPHSVRLMDYH